MKLQPDKSDVQTLTAHGPGWVAINNEKVEGSIVVGSRGERFEWDCTSFDQIGAEHFAQLAALGAELIIFGSGKRIRFPQAAWLQPLMAKRTGVETMDTPAACRTYNILAGEGRHVVAALLVEPPDGAG
ncbi:Mth938-like domain-containing protein [Variovorax sp. PAMC28562]|uniref:Mth938-like domain-containing protein n=1 Tax=Variovorax sp. PAMC28562 TaxID=2762323 RepID=UPI00164E8C93|nr:Mth938-like domain-containing protein [Variovorax sp. PAMC28562]QNK73530.1 Mth938-like domain-containing protein [Variovorax sp. PAMC28562]